ncbi:hypothetical protein PPH41_44380, partial [Burkholderia gladioli]|nr:hypothetical protein [Burkholderia gladioli]
AGQHAQLGARARSSQEMLRMQLPLVWMPCMSTVAQLALIALATVGFDLGFQSTLIAHQTIVYGIDPASRSRLNAVLFVGMFIGMSTGAAIGTLLFAQWGWTAVVAMAVLSSIGALLVRVWRRA